uniref:Gamma-conotoxin-like de7a n=1 Tax=Conasprella delessertii TaxID=2547900 RepID=O17A_CONDE|nr:RecName: Full=Gamma-conotoxin-like de7a [Conasprella delessertii]
ACKPKNNLCAITEMAECCSGFCLIYRCS